MGEQPIERWAASQPAESSHQRGTRVVIYILRYGWADANMTDEDLYAGSKVALVGSLRRPDEDPRVVDSLAEVRRTIEGCLRRRQIIRAEAASQPTVSQPADSQPTAGGSLVPRTPIVPPLAPAGSRRQLADDGVGF